MQLAKDKHSGLSKDLFHIMWIEVFGNNFKN